MKFSGILRCWPSCTCGRCPKHPFKPGDIVRDKQHGEIFAFDELVDGMCARFQPGRIEAVMVEGRKLHTPPGMLRS